MGKIIEFPERKSIQRVHAIAEAQVWQGVEFEDQGRVEDAMRAYAKAIELNPSAVDAWTNLGSLHHKCGDNDDAIKCWLKALEINPEHVASVYNLGVIFDDIGLLRSAECCYKRALALNPKHADSYYNLAVSLLKMGSYEDACQYFEKFLEFDNESKWAGYARQQINFRRTRPSEKQPL